MSELQSHSRGDKTGGSQVRLEPSEGDSVLLQGAGECPQHGRARPERVPPEARQRPPSVPGQDGDVGDEGRETLSGTRPASTNRHKVQTVGHGGTAQIAIASPLLKTLSIKLTF